MQQEFPVTPSGKKLPARSPAAREEQLQSLYLRLHETAEMVWASSLYFPCLVVLSALFLFTGSQLQGCVVLAGVFCFMAICCGDMMSLLLPALLFCLLATHFYADFGELLANWPMFVAAIVAVLLHYYLYPVRRKSGPLLRPLLAVAAATLLGGLGAIPAEQYFSVVSLYYVLALGPGMVGVYLLVRAQLGRSRGYNVLARFLNVLYYGGIFTGLVVLETYLVHMTAFLRSFSVLYFSYRNFCATILLMALPTACLPSEEGKTRWGALAFFYLSLLLTGSRSALLFGTLLLAASLLYLYRKHPENRKRYRLAALLLGVPAAAALWYLVPVLFASRMEDGALISAQDSRVTFFVQAMRDFFASPIFGKGLGNLTNSAIFIGVSGSIVWYHNLFAQILGSMGLVGAAAYGWLYYERGRLLFTKRSAEMTIAALSACGMVLVSMTNPGEFCPLPNEFLMAALFAILESLPGKPVRARAVR
jgi:hypothetical protein